MKLRACLLALLFTLPISSASAQTAAVYATDVPVTLAETMQQDASLADLTFVDRATGWAVGDRGVIWHTSDGGLQWKLQPSGVTCSLATVSFIDAARGWAAGGTTPPFAEDSRGVLLATTDGGATWNKVEQSTLPAVMRIKFFEANRGIAAGGASPLLPSGVFVTENSGKTWQPLAADAPGQWLAADFPGTLIIVNHCGSPVDRDEAGMQVWRDGLKLLAAQPNVRIKISDLVAYDHHWTIDSLRSVTMACVDAFGPERCMLGSDFPVAGLHATYDEIFGSFDTILSGLTPHEVRGMFHDNAVRDYRLADLLPAG